MAKKSGAFLNQIAEPIAVITAIDSQSRFPEILASTLQKYEVDIRLFQSLVNKAATSGELLGLIRQPTIPAKNRMSLLKIFRRSVCSVMDTETSKKITKVPTEHLVKHYGQMFKPIEVLKSQFQSLSVDQIASLAALIGEYDTRGTLGYQLTEMFFEWFELSFAGELEIEGPKGAGRDVELSSIFPNFKGNYPCDFVIRRKSDQKVLAVGFARYDSTRGGAQSDDRTGGNSNKVEKAKAFCLKTGESFRILFLSDGPGLIHGDTWREACELDGSWDGNVRVTTLKTAAKRVSLKWLMGS